MLNRYLLHGGTIGAAGGARPKASIKRKPNKKSARIAPSACYFPFGTHYFAMKGSRCQISLAYSAMVRSLENLPAQAVFIKEALFHAFGSR